MKILHTADFHLRDRDIDECETCLKFLVATAETEAVDLTVIAGDIFHSQDIKLDSRSTRLAIQTISNLADISPVAIVLGTPSHDGKAPEVLHFARGKHPIKVASVPDQWRALVGGQEIIITMMPQPTKQFFQTSAGVEASDREIGAAMSALFAGYGAKAAQYPGMPHILVGHWNVSGAQLSTGQLMTGRDIEVSVDQMNMTGADLHLLGHIHKSQKLDDRTFYSGSIYHENWGELEPKGFWIHDVNKVFPAMGAALESRFIETPCRKLVRLKSDYTDGGDYPLADGAVLPGEIVEHSIEGATVRWDITVWQDEVGNLRKNELEKLFSQLGASSIDIRINAVPRVNVRAESVLAATTLRAEIEEMAKLREETINPDVLVKAEQLENTPGEELMEKIVGGAT